MKSMYDQFNVKKLAVMQKLDNFVEFLQVSVVDTEENSN
jgi:hypothetical protein